MIFRLISILWILLSVGCTKVNSNELAGNYQAIPSEFGDLSLSVDGSYIYTFTENGKLKKYKGKWTVDKDNPIQLSFFDFLWPSFFSTQPKGIWIVEPKKQVKGVALIIDEDIGAYFLKK